MQLPRQNRNYKAHVRFGRYVASRLKTAKFSALAADVNAVTDDVKQRGRAWEDAGEQETDRIGERDAIDDGLDTAAKRLRMNLASRSLGAEKEPPYTAVFPDGVAYYTAAPVKESATRYRELVTRAEKSLPAADAALTELQGAVPAQIDAYTAAVVAVEEARTSEGIARTDLNAALDAWTVQLERVYGALIVEVGKRAAERFFPSRSKGSDSNDDEADEDSTL